MLRGLYRLVSVISTISLALLWSLIDRDNLAFAIYMVSLLNLALHLRSPNSLTLSFIILKPLLLVSGEESQLALILCLVQFLAIKHLPRQSTLLVFLTMTQYFYRTSHRERFSSLQFSRAYLGFPIYHFYLHGFLVTLNTFAPHILGMALLPYVTCRDEGGTVLALNFNQLLCSTIMSAVTKRELMFPQRTAPKYVFDFF